MKSGIYKMTCVGNGKVYIGASKDIRMRWHGHLHRFKTKRHTPYLLESLELYGVESFVFEILEHCEITQLAEKEQYWADKYKSEGYEMFNYKKEMTKPTKGLPLSENHRKKLIDHNKKNGNINQNTYRVYNEEHSIHIKKDQLQEYLDKGYKKGLHPRDIEKISHTQKKIGRKMTEYNKMRLKEAFKPPSQETKSKMSETRTKLLGIKVICLDNGEIFDSYTLAAKKYNTSYNLIKQSIIRGGKCRNMKFAHLKDYEQQTKSE